MNEPHIYYDPETDSLSVRVSEAKNRDSYEALPGVIVTVDDQGDLTAIEFIGKVKERFAPLIEQARKTTQRS